MKKRHGYTLFELILVVGIVLVASVLAAPSLSSLYSSYKLNAAVDTVRAAWAESRARAIEEGRPYRFAVEPQGTAFRVAPDHPDYWEGGEGTANDPDGRGLILEKRLPGGVRFSVNGEAAEDVPEEAFEGNLLEEREVANADWATGVIFQPDGTSREDIRVLFQIQGARPTVLILRGLTGHVSVHTE